MMKQHKPLIIGFLNSNPNRYFSDGVADLLELAGFDFHTISTASELEPLTETESRRRHEPGENIFGSSGALLDLLSREQPALLIFQKYNADIPWRDWLPMLKRSPATRRIPVLMIAVDWTDESRQEALRLGATGTMAHPIIQKELISWIRKHARIPDYDAIISACSEVIDPRGLEGIEAYNAGEYYDAHEYLEYAWQDDKGAGRDLYRSILQIAVALYQIQRGNYNGAVKMLLRVRQWLQPLPPTCRGVDVAALQEDANRYYDIVLGLGPEKLADFDWQIIRPVHVRPETS